MRTVHAADLNESARLAPIFRWPGGKRWLVDRLIELAPKPVAGYHEPFFGAGALFFALRPLRAVLSDSNRDLMCAYEQIRDAPRAVEDVLRALPRDRASYYVVRDTSPKPAVERAARFLYLTTLAFNGIYRVNRQGEFNVPFGGREYPDLGAPGSLEPYSFALGTAEIRSGDFEQALTAVRSGDFVYLDPPYTVAHGNNGFVRYNERIFSWADQNRLAGVARDLDRIGCAVVVSNAAHASVQKLYADFRSISVERRSLIAADVGRRLVAREVLFTNVG